MNKKQYNILLIDDHPLIISAYLSALNKIKKIDESFSFLIDEAHNCDIAIEKLINQTSLNHNYDLVILDISLPPSNNGKYISGEDIGLEINKLMPNTKLIVSTTYNDNYRVHNLIKNLDPEGFIIKNDIGPKNLIEAIRTVIEEPPYYSKTVTKLLRNEVTSDFILDDIDRKILYELSNGTLMKDIPDLVNLSLAAIEKRKRHLKEVFDAVGPNDKELLQKAKEKGFI